MPRVPRVRRVRRHSRGPRRLLPVLVLTAAVLLAGLASPVPASAAPVDDAISALRSQSLYVAPDSGLKLEQDTARAVLGGAVKVAVLPSGAGDPTALSRQIGSSVGGQLTVGVFVGHSFSGGSDVLCPGYAARAAARAVADNRSVLASTNDVTSTITDFARLVSTAPRTNCTSGSTGQAPSRSAGSGSSGWAILGIFGALGAAAVALLVWRRRRKERRALADARAVVQPLYDRLAAEVSSLQPGGNPVAKQALADAAERFTSTGSQLATATSVAQLGGARRSALEGLQAARTARAALGLDPGPDLPPLVETTAPQLGESQQFTVNGQNVQGYPDYRPGAPYYFAGGGGYLGGWYSAPFWQGLLIAELISPSWGWGFGGLGGWGGYGGYDSGYGSGYGSGFEAGRESNQNDAGGDWSNSDPGTSGGGWSSGGDWSSGGGDWSSGGGDFGGGDFGGGDSGGGGSGGDW
ncbi:hypothetical protein M6D93_06815 [Jatrophihabitans telluris]|uniref:TPM domain-containing protein n=1 Tax=Jatrophihabitans telluris TaxID=2038343 RepID=A0ABY4R2K0_9ACTN|nr:hypothetical protein [Jatrophihabitans telluris]UQX89707.1 hypothetical protein M6D93_06815 [Jatrophihabitans telluris]